MKYKIHNYKSSELMLQVNAFIIEAEKELVIVDTTLTMTDSLALKKMADEFSKPLAGILITHGHPDHIAGIANLAPKGEIPIYSLLSVKKLMEDTEEMKHKQWSAMFGAEWIPKWVYPNTIVKNGQIVKLAGLSFQVIDLGSGGDCDANSMWLMTDNKQDAFLGDFLYKGNHTYMNDGSVLRWIANLKRHSSLLEEYSNYHIGHGSPASFSDLQTQIEYLETYCSMVLDTTQGTAIFTDSGAKEFESKMLALYPSYGCQFMVGLSANKVASELVSQPH